MSQSSGETSKSEHDEWQIYQDLLFIVKREVSRLKKSTKLEGTDFGSLEKLSRVYANLKDDLREDLKSDLWRKAGAD